MKTSAYLAVDLGAESGRVILGSLSGDRLQLKEIHRFQNGGVRLGESLHWDILNLWREIKRGLSLVDTPVCSIGLDTWGVDFGLLDANDNLIGNPYTYRDTRTNGMVEAVFERVPGEVVYAKTGIQLMQINSLYQLFAMQQANDPALSSAKTFLNMPDLFNFFLTGVKANEFTISSTTQCYNPVERNWAFDLLSDLGIPPDIFGEIVTPGTVLGSLRTSLADELGLQNLSVVASAGHDTACAIAAVPASTDDYYHILPYFLNDWERFKHIPLGVLAHSTHLRGSGVWENGMEKPNVRVTLASKISAKDCARLNQCNNALPLVVV